MVEVIPISTDSVKCLNGSIVYRSIDIVLTLKLVLAHIYGGWWVGDIAGKIQYHGELVCTKKKGWCKIQSKAAFEQLNAKNQKNLNSKTSEANIQYATFTHIQHSKAMALNSFFSTFMAILLYA